MYNGLMNYYEVVAFPAGKRQVVATLPGLDRSSDARVQIAAAIAQVYPGQEADAIVAHAQTHAKLRGEYVVVERNGIEIATVGPEGAV